ncbi:MAG: FAD-binding oxidoreductase [Gemmatimonadaceae bacterium]
MSGAGAAHSPPDSFRGEYRTDIEARAVYSEAAGIARYLPLAVAVPADADDVALLARWATASGTALVPRGAGSSMGGGAVGPGVIVDLCRLGEIGRVDPGARSVWVGPGALRGAVDAAAAGVGLRLPVDPSSGAFCTVGGMTATNAAGAHTLRHGPMRAWVRAVDCVFADGTRATVRRGEPSPRGIPALDRLARLDGRLRAAAEADRRGTEGLRLTLPGVRKDSSGYALAAYVRTGDVVDLLVGSEGTLAFFVGIELALAPRPGGTSTVLAAFASLEASVQAAIAARNLGAAACELLDRTFLDIARQGGVPLPVPPRMEAVLLAEVEGEGHGDASDGGRLLERAFRRGGAAQVTVALDWRTERVLWEMRHRASPALSQLHPQRASMQFIEDGAVPPERLPDYVRGVRTALARHGVKGVIFGHAGDAHVHVNPLVDVHEAGWREKVEGIFADVTTLTASLGGTMTGEHGDGRLRTPLLPRLRGVLTMELYAAVKRAFDPTGVLNPGVKIPLAGQRCFGDIKYDPTLPELPVAARAALDRVAAERVYARPRLQLLAEAREATGQAV